MKSGELRDFFVFWTLFLATCVLVGSIAHRYVQSLWVANLLTAAVVVAGLICADAIKLGYIDGWLMIAGPIAALLTFGVAACVGTLMDSRGVSKRTKRSNGS